MRNFGFRIANLKICALRGVKGSVGSGRAVVEMKKASVYGKEIMK